MEEICQELALLLAHDPGHRGIPALSTGESLLAAATTLLQAKRVLLVSGFYIGRAEAWETDGPLGTLVLAAVLERAGVAVTVCTDLGCLPIFQRGARVLGLKTRLAGFPPGLDVSEKLLSDYQPDVLVSVERAGRALDGGYYNASGFEISRFVAHFDNLFHAAGKRGIPTVAVGDGGNELGFGRCLTQVQSLLGPSASIACATSADFLVACGVSNWGAYALAALYAMATGSGSLVDEQVLLGVLHEMVAAGAIDGVAMHRAPTVDGLPIQEEVEMFRRVNSCARCMTRTAD